MDTVNIVFVDLPESADIVASKLSAKYGEKVVNEVTKFLNDLVAGLVVSPSPLVMVGHAWMLHLMNTADYGREELATVLEANRVHILCMIFGESYKHAFAKYFEWTDNVKAASK